MSGSGGAMSLAGAVQQSLGSIYSGVMQGKVADVEARQLRINASNAAGAGTTAAEIMRKKTALVQSAARTAAGASGAGVTDETVQNVQAETGRTGEYNALAALYAGNTEAQNLREQAGLTEFAGEQAQEAGGYNAVGALSGAPASRESGFDTLGEQGASMLDKFGGQLPEWFESLG